MKNHILNSTDEELQRWLSDQRLPKFRAGQVEKWLYQNRATGFGEMTDLPAALREQFTAAFDLFVANEVKRQTAEDGSEKLLLQWPDGGRIECVLLRDGVRRSICISSQVGCAMGCVFCASGLDGVDRNLTSGEIIEQMLRLQRLLPADERLSHIVVMGMGEPLANLERLLPALHRASSPAGLGISPRRITISTVGLPPAIRTLAQTASQYQLAVSLHAPNDELRNRLVPVNKNIGLAEIMSAADEYFKASGRRLTFEYVLLGGLNDRPEHAAELARLIGRRTALLNVIPYNPVAGLPYETPTDAAQNQFRHILENAGVNIQFRKRKGAKINAACGQLRRSTPVDLQT